MRRPAPTVCLKCGGRDLKRYPHDFDDGAHPVPPSVTVRLSERPEASHPEAARPILVCIGCGHNEDLP